MKELDGGIANKATEKVAEGSGSGSGYAHFRDAFLESIKTAKEEFVTDFPATGLNSTHYFEPPIELEKTG